jgi:4-hydroxybenzoate polyprenyltransferase
MSSLRLVATMLRYRVASLLAPFFLLAPALHGGLGVFRWTYVAGMAALLASYVVATCLNDVFDLEVDRVNHPHSTDRPLVSGRATVRDLQFVALAFAVLALGVAASIGPPAVLLIAISLGLNVAYSAPPLRLCARPLFAPLVLGFAYVALPYGVGLAAAGAAPARIDVAVVAAFLILIVGRMLLKDFRDLRGDAAFGKRTFLVAYGKRATLLAVLACVAAGDAVLTGVETPNLMLILVTQSYFAAIGLELYRLWRAGQPIAELQAIARGARMGNAVVLTWLGFVLVRGAGATPTELAALVLALAASFWFGFLLPAPPATAATAAAREPTAAEPARAS